MRYEFRADKVRVVEGGQQRLALFDLRSDQGWQLVAAFPDLGQWDVHHFYFQRPATTGAKVGTKTHEG